MIAIVSDTVCDCGRIEPAGLQLPPAYQRLSVGHLKDPRTRRSFRRIEEFGPPVNVEEDLLNKVLRFRGVAKDPMSNGKYGAGVPTEQVCQELSFAARNFGE